MHILSLKNKKLWCDSVKISLYIFGIIAPFFSIIGFSINSVLCYSNLLYSFLFVLGFFIILVIIISIIHSIIVTYFISIKVHGMTVNIKQGDIFQAKGKLIIPCNEYFDTSLSDNIVSEKTLHGMFLKYCVADTFHLKKAIENTDDSKLTLKKYNKNNRTAYPLGRIILYEDFMLLSFSEYNDQNEARLSKQKYENCLINMWKEICRTYSHTSIYLPLLGSGVTRFDDWQDRSNFELLKYLIYTLYISRVDIRKPITIILTKDAIKDIDIYELKGVKYL